MKVDILKIAKRDIVWADKIGIYANDDDNAYSERVELLTNNSVTAKMATKIMAQYLLGMGYGDLGIFKINDNQNLQDFSREIAYDFVLNNGCYIHFDYDANFEPVNPKLIPFFKCRIGRKDSKDYNGKILYKEKWDNSKETPIVFDVFNPLKSVVEKQIKTAGSVLKYKGQILFYSLDRKYIYPLSRIDAVMLDCDSEAQASVYKNNLLRKGFFGKHIIVTPTLVSNDLPQFLIDNDGNQVLNPDFIKKESEAEQVKKTIESFMGAENSGGAMLLQAPDFSGDIDEVFKVIPIDLKIDDKLFDYTENSVCENILMAFNNLPIQLVKSPDSAMFGGSGEVILQAKKSYWENTTSERNALEVFINKILSYIPTFQGKTVKTTPLIQEINDNNSVNN